MLISLYLGLYQGDNNIMAFGVKSLVECSWKNLRELSLCTDLFIELEIMLLVKDPWSFLNPIGKISKN